MKLKCENVKAAALAVAFFLSGAAFASGDPVVRVQQITGVDEDGEERVLFEERSGVATPLSELADSVDYINARLVPRKGLYTEITIKLSRGMFAAGGYGSVTSESIDEEARVVHLDGALEVKKNKVEGKGLAVKPEDEARISRQLPQDEDE